MASFTTCRSCRNDIPIAASKCMYCHEDQNEYPDGKGILATLWEFAWGLFFLWLIFKAVVWIFW